MVPEINLGVIFVKFLFNLALLSVLSLSSACSMLPDWLGDEDEVPLTGERLAVLKPSKSSLADLGIELSETDFPAVRQLAVWGESPGDAERMGNLDVSTKLDNQQSARCGDGNAFRGTYVPAPVSDGERIYCMDSEGFISAHKIADIQSTAWEASVAKEDEETKPLPGGGLAVGNGVLFAVTGGGDVAAFEAATGKSKWRISLSTPIRSSLRAGNAKLFLVSADNVLYALDQASGKTLWKHKGLDEGAAILGAATPAAKGNVVIAGFSSGELFALNSDSGKVVWADAPGASSDARLSDIDANPVIAGGAVIVGTSNGTLNAIAGSNGQQIWEEDVIAADTPWIAGNYLFAITPEGLPAAVKLQDGLISWVAAKPEDDEDSEELVRYKGPIMIRNRLAVAGSDGSLKLFRAEDGELFRELEIPDGYTSALIAFGNALYLVTADAELIKLN